MLVDIMRANRKEHWKQIYLSLFLVVISTHTVFSQTGELGSWNIVHVRYNFNDRLSLFGEGQLRSLKFYDNYHYYEYKGGINFRLHQQLQISLGAGSYQTYREGGDFVLPKNNDEFRIWPQVIFFNRWGRSGLNTATELNPGSRPMATGTGLGTGWVYLIHLENNKTGTSPFRSVPAMRFFSPTENPILNGIDFFWEGVQTLKCILCTSRIFVSV